MQYEEKKLWVEDQLANLDVMDLDDLRPMVKKITEFKNKLMKDQSFFNTNRGDNEIKEHPNLKAYKDFVSDLKFEKGKITINNYFANLQSVKSSYRTYLRGK